jgi:HAD superfamily hydrolase (TIGR01509 family)
MEGRPTRLSELKFIWRIGRILSLPWWKKTALLAAYPKLRQTARGAPPVEGVYEAVQRLKREPGIKLALVTSRSRKDAIDKLQRIKILNQFDAIVTRDDVKNFKPSPEQVELAAQLLNLPVKRCVLVGDMPTDVDAAKRVGAFSVAVATGIFPNEAKERKPDLVVRSLTDLPDFIEEISDRLE